MARCIMIVQGEGRGHLSQSLALIEYLEESGHSVEAVFAGCHPSRPFPGYFREAVGERLVCFSTPFFLKTPNKKGIYVGLTLLVNLFKGYRYIREIRRIRREIRLLKPDVIFNFYDLLGSFAMAGIPPGIRRIGVGHHFFLHLDGYRCGGGNPLHRRFLSLLTRMIMRNCDKVLALSFREVAGVSPSYGRKDPRIVVVPPLVRKHFRETLYSRGSRYLVYLLNEGFITELISIARNDPEFRADIFSELPAETPVPPGILLHPLSDREFREKMRTCRGLVATSGFDTIAEAAYLGVPLAVVPVRNHFEQLCNSADTVRSGLGAASEEISAELFRRLEGSGNPVFRKWVDRAGELIIKEMQE